MAIFIETQPSIPVSAMELGLDTDTYHKLRLNVGRIAQLTKPQRQEILKRADLLLPRTKTHQYSALIEDLASDPEAYKMAGLKYHEGPPKEEKIFTIAVADFCIRRV